MTKARLPNGMPWWVEWPPKDPGPELESQHVGTPQMDDVEREMLARAMAELEDEMEVET